MKIDEINIFLGEFSVFVTALSASTCFYVWIAWRSNVEKTNPKGATLGILHVFFLLIF